MAGKTQWTDEQKQAIDSRGQSLLVSAAAGSGKTAVLVQRILDEIMSQDHPYDIDRLLIVTFTNAAASQLREKIRKRLQEEAAGDDRKRRERAQRQISLLAGDHIETIDRFCREVALDHADMLGIDPGFIIADDGERKLMQSEAVSECIEEAYSSDDEEYAAGLREFSTLYAPGRTDRALEDMVLDFYEFSQSHPFPAVWRKMCAERYRDFGDDSAIAESMMSLTMMRLRDIRGSISLGYQICLESGGPYHYAAAMKSHEVLLDSMLQCRTPSQLGQVFASMPWPRPGSKKKTGEPDVDGAKLSLVKTIRDRAKKELDRLKKKLFGLSREETLSIQEKTAGYMDVLVRMTDSFSSLYGRTKRERNRADFSDVSHWALNVLIETDENGYPVTDKDGNYVPTVQALEYAGYFEEIYIDEYQDSNLVQETILRSISAGPEKGRGRFLVGDVKQSIYRFRMADPEIFVEKARLWPMDESALRRRIDLHSNFRSRGCVIDTVNLIFSQIMRREIGGVEYDESQMLRQGFPFPDDTDEDCPELILVERSGVPEAGDRAEAEAETVARRIVSLMSAQMVYDKDLNVMRRARYGDIAVLLRSSKGWAETFSRVFRKHGIPCATGANTGYFDAPEVRTILSYLHVLDNPRQDIPLAASLRSGIGHMTDDDLAAVRAYTPDSSLYECVVRYMEDGPAEEIRSKLKTFAEKTERLRGRVNDTPMHILLWQIFDETGFADTVLASEGGRQKRANLDLLVDRAISYESASYQGLFHFIRYIEKLRKGKIDFGPAQSGPADEDKVRIMTMHASKGLEFPIVFVSGLGKKHNLSDARGSLQLHGRLGAGMDYRDPRLRVIIPNRISSVISDQIVCDSVGEELRILYVAMTRAQEKLIMTGCVDDLETYLHRMGPKRVWPQEKFSGNDLLGASCMLDWVVWGLLRCSACDGFFDREEWGLPPSPFAETEDMSGKVKILTVDDMSESASFGEPAENGKTLEISEIDPGKVYDSSLHERLRHMLTSGYPHEDLSAMPAKLSVSELKAAGYAAELARLDEEEAAVSGVSYVKLDDMESTSGAEEQGADTAAGKLADVPVPRFMQEGSETLSPTARGTAYHEVLAAIDMTRDMKPSPVPALLETMVKCDRIQKEEARAVNPAKIDRFLESELGGRMRQAAARGQLFREQPFVIERKGNLIDPSWSGDENVLIQGIIDAYFFEDDNVVLVDYKTDRVRPGEEESLVRRYRTQFELYRDALETLLDRKVSQSWLYSLSLGKAIAVD